MLLMGLNRKWSRHSFQSMVMVPSLSILSKQHKHVLILVNAGLLGIKNIPIKKEQNLIQIYRNLYK